MKKFLMAVMAVVLTSVMVYAAADKFVVDDFTSGKTQASSGGWWYTYSDANSGGNSVISPAPDKFVMAKSDNKFAAAMQGTVGNKLGWDFVGMGVTLDNKCGCPGKAEPVDLSKYTTMTLRIKGTISGGRLTVLIPYTENKCVDGKSGTLTEWADYELALNSKLSKDWTIVKVDLRKDLKQPKWAKVIVPIEKVLQNAHNISFHFMSPDGDKVDIQIDTIEFN